MDLHAELTTRAIVPDEVSTQRSEKPFDPRYLRVINDRIK